MKNVTPTRKIEAVRVRCTMSTQERSIVNVLTPRERLDALLEAGRRKMQALLEERPAGAVERTESI